MGLITTTILVKFLVFISHPLVELILVVVSDIAVAMIIVKAGYSRRWISIPAIPSVLAIVVYLWTRYFASSSHNYSTNTSFASSVFQVVLFVEVLTFLLAWFTVIAFALSAWPLRIHFEAAKTVGPRFTNSRSYPGGTGATPVVPPPLRTGPPGIVYETVHAPSDGTLEPAAATVSARSVTTVRTIHCSRCGEAMADGSEFFHECAGGNGSTVFCANCGNQHDNAENSCTSCGTQL
jgi:hypothetical protein